MDNSLKKILSSGLSNLSNIFSSDKSSRSVLGIDIGSSAIKVVQLKTQKGKAILETYGSIALGPYAKVEIGQATNLTTDDIARALNDALKESNTTTRFGIMGIPSLSSLIFTISLPDKVTEGELRTIIPNEARKYIPVPISEVMLDWFMIPREASVFENNINQAAGEPTVSQNKVEVLVVAIHTETITRFREILEKTQIQSESPELEIFGNIRSSFDHDIAPVLLLDFGASKTKLCIVESGIVRVFHVINRGSQDITRNISSSLSVSFADAENLKRKIGISSKENPEVVSVIKLSTDYIFSDANSVVLAYEKKYNKTISKVILTGGGSMLPGFIESATSIFKAQVVLGDPFAKLEAPAFLEPVLKNSGPEFAIAIGLALRQLS